MNRRLLSTILPLGFFLIGCSSQYNWEREQYFQRNRYAAPLTIYMAPTMYGEGKLSSKGPYRPVLHYSTDCTTTHIELKKIELIRGEKLESLPIQRFKMSFKEYESDRCLTTFASDIWLDIDFEKEKQFEVRVRYFTEENMQRAIETSFILEASFSSGSTKVPWISV